MSEEVADVFHDARSGCSVRTCDDNHATQTWHMQAAALLPKTASS